MRRYWLGPFAAGLVISTLLGCAATNNRKGQSRSVSKSPGAKSRPNVAAIADKREPASGGPVLRSPGPDQTSLFSPPPAISSDGAQASNGPSGPGFLLLATPTTAPSTGARAAEPAPASRPPLKGGDDTGWTRTTSLAKAPQDAPADDSPDPGMGRDAHTSWAGLAPQQIAVRETPPPVLSNARASTSAPGPRRGTAMDHAQDYSWVQGRLEYSVVGGGVWKVRYASPSTDDEHGGSVVLDRDPTGHGCQAGDTDYVQGQVIASPQRSTLSNPSYRVQRIMRAE